MSACMFVYHMHAGQRGCQIPWNWSYRWVCCPVGDENPTRPLKEPLVLLTSEPSLHHPSPHSRHVLFETRPSLILELTVSARLAGWKAPWSPLLLPLTVELQTLLFVLHGLEVRSSYVQGKRFTTELSAPEGKCFTTELSPPAPEVGVYLPCHLQSHLQVCITLVGNSLMSELRSLFSKWSHPKLQFQWPH